MPTVATKNVGEPLWRALRRERTGDDRPHHVANMVLRRFKIDKPPVPVERIAVDLGTKLVREPATGWVGAIDSTIDPPTIWVNSNDAVVRQRFTIGHELGHLLMHPLNKLLRDATFARPGDAIEEEANEFAAALLMPLWMLEPIAKLPNTKASDIAAWFKVSHGALAIQLRKLT